VLDLLKQAVSASKLCETTAKLALNKPKNDDNTRQSLKRLRISVNTQDFTFNLSDFSASEDIMIGSIQPRKQGIMFSNEPEFPSNIVECRHHKHLVENLY